MAQIFVFERFNGDAINQRAKTKRFVKLDRNSVLSSQALGKREPEQEREAQEWIEAILGEPFPAGE